MTNQPTQTGADRPVDMIIFGGGGGLPPASCCPRCTWRTCTATFRPRRASSRSAAATGASTAIASSWTSSRVRSSTKGVRSSGLEPFPRPVQVRADRRERTGRLPAARGSGARRRDPRVLPVDVAGAVHHHLRQPVGRASRRQALARRPRKAARPRSRVREGDQRCGRQALRGIADLSDRPLSRQGNRAEPDGAALRQPDLRAAVAGAEHPQRADHGGGDGGRRQSRGLLRPYRRAARHGAEPPVAAAVHRRDGAAGVARPGRGARRS